MSEAKKATTPLNGTPRRWFRNRIWIPAALVLFMFCFGRLWQDANYSRVGYAIWSRLARAPKPALSGVITFSQAVALESPSTQLTEQYTVRVDEKGIMTRFEERGSWDDFGPALSAPRGQTLFISRVRMLECQHLLIPWHFKGRVAWSVASATSTQPPDNVKDQVLSFLTQDLGPNSTRGKEIAAVRAGNDLVEWRDWLAFAMNVGLVVSSTYLFVTILRLPWLIRTRLREYRVRKAFKAGLCTKCGYDLSGTHGEAGNKTCPECGERISIDTSRPTSREHAHPA